LRELSDGETGLSLGVLAAA
jgi:hypothetical protein